MSQASSPSSSGMKSGPSTPVSVSSTEHDEGGQYILTPRAIQEISSTEESAEHVEESAEMPVLTPEREEEPEPLTVVEAESTPPTTGRGLDTGVDIEVVEESPRLRRSRRVTRTPVQPPVPESVPSTRRRTRALAALDESESPVSPKRLRFEQGESSKSAEDVYVPGDLYLDQEAADKGFYLRERSVLSEKPVSFTDYNKYGLINFLKAQGLEKTITDFSSYSLDLVREFYANYKPGEHVVYLRGYMVSFSPELISQHYKLPIPDEEDPDLDMESLALEISGGMKKTWDYPGKMVSMKTINLTAKYAVLYKVGMYDWFPVRHQGDIDLESAQFLRKIVSGGKFDMGRWIFSKINKVAASTRGTQLLIFPCLLSSFILATSPVDYTEAEIMESPEGEVKIHPRLLQPPHIMDLVPIEAQEHASTESSSSSTEVRHSTEFRDFTPGVETSQEATHETPEAPTGPSTDDRPESSSASIYDKLIEDLDARITSRLELEAALLEQIKESKEERKKMGQMRVELHRLKSTATDK